VIQCVRHFIEAKKPIAAICHGPQLLVAAGGLRGRTCTAYPAVKPDLVAAGAEWREPAKGLDNAHIDGNLVTAPAWPAHAALMKSFLEVLGAPVRS
jgi:protease I